MRFSSHWNRQRRRLLKTSAGWAGLLTMPALSSAAVECGVTPATEDGPLYPAEPIPWASDLTRAAGGSGHAKGQAVHLFGEVKGADCGPVSDATVEVWQADSRGYYKHPRHDAPEGLDPNFRYFGKVRVDSAGRYRIKTIVPSWYRIFEIERAAHIHIKVKSPANGVLTTEVYFSGADQDARRQADPVFQSRRGKERLIAQLDRAEDSTDWDLDAEDGARRVRYDLLYRL